MKHAEFIEKEYDKFFAKIDQLDSTKDKQLTKFVKWCFDHGFLDNMSDENLADFYDEDSGLYLPLLRNHGITIGIDMWDVDDRNHCEIGIDPTDCFNKIRHCSILMELPITSKREEQQFYKTLEKILDKKSRYSKDWFNSANTLWYGKFLTNRAFA